MARRGSASRRHEDDDVRVPGDDEDRRPRRGRSRDDEDDAPRGRSRGRSRRDEEDDDYEDEEPRGRRSSRARDEDEDDAPRGRRSTRGRRDEEEDDEEDRAPRGRRSSRSRDEEDDEPPARRGRGSRRAPRDDDDDEPRRGSSRGRASGGRSSRTRDDAEDQRSRTYADKVGSGWTAVKDARKVVRSGGKIDKDDYWRPSDEERLVKFLDDEPFASHAQHWIQFMNRSFVCPASLEDPDDCPICEMTGDSPSVQVYFNVVVFEPDDKTGEFFPELRCMRGGTKLSDTLQGLSQGRHGPLTKHYWELTATGTKGSYNLNANVMKEADVIEDWEIDPLTDDELDEFEEHCWDASIIYIHSYEDLQDVARKMNRG